MSYLYVSKSRSRVEGFHYLGPMPDPITLLPQQHKFLNAPVGAASESEIAAVYINARKAISFRMALLEKGHRQTFTSLWMGKDASFGVLTSRIIPKKSKAIDMRFFWLRDRGNQKQSKLHWREEACNLADYFTKHHATPYHQKMRKIYLSSCQIWLFNNIEYDTLRHMFPLHARVC